MLKYEGDKLNFNFYEYTTKLKKVLVEEYSFSDEDINKTQRSFSNLVLMLKSDGDNSAAFDFHHRDPKTKKMNICTSLENSLKDLEEECKKCDLICSNCHRILHARE